MEVVAIFIVSIALTAGAFWCASHLRLALRMIARAWHNERQAHAERHLMHMVRSARAGI